MNIIQRTLAVISLLLVAACGGGGGEGPAPTQTVSGKVADGYLVGAKVCIDLDLNKKCDVGEPTAVTGAGGSYTMSNVLSAQVASYPIVVEVPAGATDSDRGPVVTPYVLTAPAGRPEFVSPLTTLVQYQIEKNGFNVSDAISTVKTQLGLATLSPLDDYKSGTSGTVAEQKVAAGVAMVVATAFAANKETIQTAVPNSTSREVVNLVVQQAIDKLPAVVAQVNTVTGGGATALTDIQGVITATAVTVIPSDTTLLQQQLAAAGATTTSATTMRLTLALQGSVSGAEAVITLPSGVSIDATSNGEPLTGVLSGKNGALGALITGNYTPASSPTQAKLKLALISTSTISSGDIVVITCKLASGVTAPSASQFALSDTKLIDNLGHTVSGTLTLH